MNFAMISSLFLIDADGKADQSKSASQIRQTLSKVVENAVGDTVDWVGYLP